MATKPTLKKIEQIANNEEAAVALFNDNFNTLEEVIQDSVSRSGKVPTNMLDNLDMGDKRIINLGKAVGDNDAVRYKDVKEALKETQNAKVYAQNAENAAIRADASAALADTSKREAQMAAAGAKTSEDNAQMIYDELITNEAVATVHENIADVNTVAADINNVSTAATNIEDIKAVFDIAKRISYGNIGDISATAANIAPDGCRFLNGDVISRADFPDAFKMLDEGTLPSTPVSAYNAATELVLPYTVISGSPTRSGSVLTVPSSSKITLTTTAAIPGSSATKVFRTRVKVTTAPLPAAGGGAFEFAFGSLSVQANGSGFKFGFSYFLGSGTSSGSFPSTNVFECNKWYTIESTLNGNSIENKVYDGSSLIETVVSDWNDLENYTRSEFFIENVSAPIVYDIDLASTQLVLDDVSYFNGTIVEPQGSVPYFGFDRGSSIAYLPVAQDIFLEAGDVHAALVEAGLPNITGHFYGGLSNYTYYGDGAFYRDSSVKGNTDPYGDGGNRDVDSFGFSAARSNPVYGNSNTVQPAALKYRHYIVLSHREQMIFTMRDSVKAYKDLPKTGNINGDIRMVTDQGIAYIWCRYSRDAWGWSSIGQYLTITAPGKFAWGALGGDLRAQTDLYERLQIPSRAIAGSGILFSEETGGNYKKYLPEGDTGPFGFSEDGSYLTSCPPYGTLMLDQIDFTKDFTCNIRLADFNTNAVIMAGGFGWQSYLLFRKADPTIAVQLYASPYLSLTLPSSSLTEDEVDIRVSKNANNITLSVVLPSTGEVIGEVSRASSFYQPANALYLGNRPQYGVSANNKINLKGTWVEQDGVKTFAYEDIEDPKTIIEVEDYDKIMKNVSKGSTVVLTNGNTTPNYMGSQAYGIGSVNYINNYAIGFGSNAYAYGQKGVALGYNAKAIGEGSFQLGEGENKEAFTLQFRDTPIVVENKLASASLPLVAGEGIALEAGAPRKAYHVVGSPQVNDNILTVATTEDAPSYLMSDPREYFQKSLRSMTLQLALKNVGVHKGSSTSYSEDSVFKFVAPFATKGETKYNNWNILNVTVSEYYGIRVYGIISGSIALSQVEGRDVLIEVSIGRSSPWTRTLRYSLDDGASWTVVQSEAESDEPVYVYYPTLQIGRCASYYSTYGRFTGSFDLSKTFFTDHVLGSASFNFEMTKPSNELVISADIPDDIGGTTALEDIAVAGEGITFTKQVASTSYTVVGSPKISSDQVVSDFSDSNYLTAIEPIRLEENLNSFEICAAIKLDSTAATNYGIFEAYGGTTTSASWRLSVGNTVLFRAQPDSGVDMYFVNINGTSQIATGVKTYIKVTYSSTEGYKLFTKTDSADAQWVLEGSASETGRPRVSLQDFFYIGDNFVDGLSLPGSLYLEDCYIDVNGVRAWTAALKGDKTEISANVDLTGYLQNTAAGTDALALLGGTASGNHSVAIGANTQALGNRCITIGEGATTSSTYESCVAIGDKSTSTNNGTVAVGNYASATGNYGTAVGKSATASGGSSVALGQAASASGAFSTAVGYNAEATKGHACCFGAGADASGSSSVGLGSGAGALADFAIQLGRGTNRTANTFNVGLGVSLNVQLLDANGQIPGERMSLQGTTAPDTTTVGSVGQFYVDTATGTGYMCVGVSGSTYTWKQITV